MAAAEAQLPLYLARRPSDTSSSPLDDDEHDDSNRQSFPATVRESYASTWTTGAASSKRESLRGPPPPLPPKPAAWSAGIQPPPLLQRGKSTSDLDGLARAGGAQQEQEMVEQEAGSPKEQGSPSQWLDIMFGHAEGHHVAPFLSRTTSGSTPNPFPSAPRLPPRPPARLDSPAPPSTMNRAPSPAIQLTASPSLPSLSSAPPLPSRPSQPAPPSHPSRSNQSSSSLPPPSSSPSTTSALNTLNQGIQHLKLKDRFAAGVGFGREWGGKGKNKVQEGWRVGQAAVGGRPGSAGGERSGERLGTSPTEDSGFGAAGTGRARSTSPLPSTILGHRIPKNPPHLAFGLPLVEVVDTTRVREEGGQVHRKKDDDPVTGDEARRWLPSVALRCLQYLEEWGKTEEGVYRVPGRSNLVTQLRALFTSGIDLDLREIHPGDLDPHAVASLFKYWLREIPESLLSPKLEGRVEEMSIEALGCGAGGGTFLGGGQRGSAGPGAGGVGGAAGLVDGRAPRGFLEELRKVFAEEMEAEFFYLLRALSYHLARLASHSGTNKMTLSNLRLILSPTLRLSPVFLQILVEEREIIFGKTNESARSRESSEFNPPRSPGLASTHSSPSFSTYNAPSTSSRQSPLLGPPSPRLNIPPPSPPSSTHSSTRFPSAAPTQRRGSNSEWQAKARGVDEGSSAGGAEWLIVDEPSEYEALAAASASSALIGAGARGSPSSLSSSNAGFPVTPSLHSTSAPPTPSSADFPPRATRTPIADRFVSTFSGGSPGARSSNGSNGSEFSPSVDSPPLSAGLSPMTAHFSAGSTSPKLGGGGGGPPVPPPKPFIPSRTTAAQASTGSGGGFFGNRSPVLGSTSSLGSSGGAGAGAGAGEARKGSVTSLTDRGATSKDANTPQPPPTSSSAPLISPIGPSYPPRSSSANSLNSRRGAVGGGSLGSDIDALSSRRGAITPVELDGAELSGLGVVVGAGGEGEGGEKERLRERRGSADRLHGARGRQWSDDSESTTGSLNGGGRHQIPRKPVPRRASLGDQSTTSLRSSIDSSSSARPSIESTRSFASSSISSAAAPVPRAPIALPSLELPAGLGLGMGLGVSSEEGGKEEGEDRWGLLSVEERRRFFGG